MDALKGRHTHYRRSTLVVSPKVDEPFDGIEAESVPDVAFRGNLGRAWSVGKLLPVAASKLVENHPPAAAVPHSQAYKKAAAAALRRAEQGLELKRFGGLAFCSDCLAHFRMNFPARAHQRAIPNGLDMGKW
jgi:hypothetical protein